VIYRAVVDSPTSLTMVVPFFPEKGACPLVQSIDSIKSFLASVVILLVWVTALPVVTLLARILMRIGNLHNFHISMVLLHKESIWKKTMINAVFKPICFNV